MDKPKDTADILLLGRITLDSVRSEQKEDDDLSKAHVFPFLFATSTVYCCYGDWHEHIQL